ncbi:MAG: sigma-70 family RNA polymerase sigma factor [Chitinophagaceae bacterium]|nr:sigma-70 family RNA polymerase sigma factor [Polaromonas sp.]
MTVQSILQRIAEGEPQAFAALVALYEQPLFGFLGRMGLSQAQAEDIAQETFLRAWTNLPSYDADKAQFGTWLFTIARHLAYNALQSAPQRNEVAGLDVEALSAASGQPGPANHFARSQQSAALQAALRQLPMADRSALALVYVHELALAEVARIEGGTVASIKTRLHRAKQKLRALLSDTLDLEIDDDA